uniref:Follistatin-related protein 1-like n=1 Tax=Sinocyclocheilus rhinocerous TaxID=307959 RepID=A0A673MJP8_9TELE
MFRCLPVFFLLAVVCCYAEVSYVKPAFIKEKSSPVPFELSIHKIILFHHFHKKKEKNITTVFNIDSNTKCLLSSKSNYDNGDSQLDSAELLKFIQHNETAVQMNSYAEEENNRLLRSLCVDALVELSDENADWKLSFDEFLSCLKPGFNPPEKKCALEDETYEDGAETQVECNRCVCACGNWVCTAMTCDEKSPVIDTNGDQEMTEEEWTRRVAELNKHQETVEKMKTSTKEV